MICPDIYFIITENCNLKCKHCYMSAGPRKKHTTISEKNFRKIIKNLPKTPLSLWLAGGEVFTVKNELYSFLDYIKFTNKKRRQKNQGKITPGIQTNGFWATSDNHMEKILKELNYFGVTSIDIASDDKYHREQGIKKEIIKRLDKVYYKDLFPFPFDILIRGTVYKRWVMPIGRAKENGFKVSKFKVDCNYCKNALTDYDLCINSKGKGNMCCFNLSAFDIGNVTEEPLVNIIKKAKQNKRFNILDKKGIRGLALLDGHDKSFVKETIKKYGECSLCYRLYTN